MPLGETDRGTLHLDLNRLLAGRCLIQGSSGAGKSATLRHLIEEAHDYLTVMVVTPASSACTARTPGRMAGADPTWTDEQIAILRRDYGRVPTPERAARLGRKKGGVFMRGRLA